ncbi:MAG TPA: transposase [Myxococcales bacterium]|nr:transposase [Myxococcales bacterium]
MRKSKFSEEQIIGALKQADASSVEDVCRRLGVSRNTFYRWKAKFGGMDVSEARKLRALEEENRRLKRLVADLSLDVQMLKDINAKKW